MKRQVRYRAVVAALILAGSFLAAVPAAAENSGGIDPGNGVLKDGVDKQSTTGEGTGPGAGGEEQPTDNDGIEDQLPQGPIGPVGITGVPTYGAVWAPDEMIPTAVEILFDDANVELFTFEPEDRSLFAALLLIDSQEAPTEYRFENAVPEGHTAELHPDGSVRFFDADGNASGGIASPWAIDANGEKVPTRYTLDGTTLIQAIDHEGAAYPVAADPAWFLAVPVLIKLWAPTAAAVLSACGPAQCVAVARGTGSAVYNHVRPRGGSSGGGRPTNTPTCNARNPSGC